MWKYFSVGLKLSRKHLEIVIFVFLIDFGIILISKIMSFQIIPPNIFTTKLILFHYNVVKFFKYLPIIIKTVIESIITFLLIKQSFKLLSFSQFNFGNKKTNNLNNTLLKYLSLVFIFLMWFLAVLLPFLLLISILALTIKKVSVQFILLALSILFFLSLFISVFFYFAPYALLEDNRTIIDSIRLSFNIAKNNFSKVLLFINTYLLIVLASMFSISLIFAFYLYNVEKVTGSLDLNLITKISLELIIAFVLRFISISVIFASTIFYKELLNNDNRYI